MLWALDAEKMIGTNQFGHRIRLNPFLGNIGMPPPEDGPHSTASPFTWGGNIDCKDLIAGTRLYLPVPVEGGLLSFGDGHAAQGHGEVSVNAIECPMESVRLRLELLSDVTMNVPRAWTPDGWLTFGFHADLEQAALIALNEMIVLMMAHYQLSSRKQALGLATALVDLHITQIANPIVGVHAFLSHNALV
jgi:acetamidase/formamidase